MLVAQAGSIQLWDVGLRVMKGSVKIAPGGTVSVALDPLAQFLAAGYMPPSIIEEGKKAADRTVASIDYSRTPVLWKTSDQQPALFIDLAAHPPPSAAGTDPPPDTADKPVAPSPSANDSAKAAVGVAFSPDGRYFVATSGDIGAGGSITFYERQPSTRQDAIFKQLKSSAEFTTASTPYFAAFSGDGGLLAVSQQSGETLLIDVETRRQQGKLPSATGEIGRLAFSPDGALLGTVSFDNRLMLWDIATRTPFGRPITLGDATGPLGIAFSPDGRWLLTADANLNSLVAFDLNVASWVNQACDVAGRQLSDQERLTYKLPPDLRVGCAPR
jgi:WD40 repeat protein